MLFKVAAWVWYSLLAALSCVLAIITCRRCRKNAGIDADPTKRKEVVIVGGSFAGLNAARHLAAARIPCTIVEPKDYFEYVPGMLHCLVNPKHFDSISVPISDVCPPGCRVVKGLAEGISYPPSSPTDDTQDVRPQGTVQLAGGAALPFDYCIVATGSDYPGVAKACAADQEDWSAASRRKHIGKAAADIASAKHVLIIGGGTVGVELASEVLYKFRSVRVTIVSKSPRLLADQKPSLGAIAAKWITSRKGRVIVSDSAVQDPTTGQYRLESTQEPIDADIVYMCAGYHACSDWVATASAPSTSKPGTAVPVDDSLTYGHPQVFAVGDVASHSSRLGGLASIAEFQAKCAARSIAASILTGKAAGTAVAYPYPGAITYNRPPPRIMCISLGPWEALVVFNGIVLTSYPGRLVGGVLKTIIEVTKMWEVRGYKVGKWFWEFGDAVTFALNRTVVPPQPPIATRG